MSEIPILNIFPVGLSNKDGYWRLRKIYLRSRLCEAQNHRCCFCQREFVYIHLHPQSPTLDHVIPKSKGGDWDKLDNQVVACRYCNGRKGNRIVPLGEKSYQEFVRYLTDDGRFRSASEIRKEKLK